MNRLKKQLTVRYFSLVSEEGFFDNFVSTHKANLDADKPARITKIKDRKYLVKIHESIELFGSNAFFISVLRERNTWQLKGLGTGQISGISNNQGIIGDPYYLMVIPDESTVLGFTTGPIVSLKSVAENVLSIFNKDRSLKIVLDRIGVSREPSVLKDVQRFKKLHFKIKTSLLNSSNDDTPGLLRDLSSVPFITNNSEIELTISEPSDQGIPEKDMIDMVDYLSESEGCSALKVQGVDTEGGNITLDFVNTYASYKTTVELRNNYLDEKIGKKVLNSAVDHYFQKIKTT